jgi:hypothetical protein
MATATASDDGDGNGEKDGGGCLGVRFFDDLHYMVKYDT